MGLPYTYRLRSGFGTKKWILLGLQGSVGQFGTNRLNDVKLVQSLLNLVPIAKGGANPRLIVDGLAGTNTNNAIGIFQTKRNLMADKRVDVGQKTIAALIEDASAAGPLPTGFMNLAVPAPEPIPTALSTIFPDPESSYDTSITSIFYTNTGWKVDSPFSVSIDVSTPAGPSAAGAIGILELSKVGASPAVTKRYSFKGAGLSLGIKSPIPFGFGLSLPTMLSWGTNVYRLPSLSVPGDFSKGLFSMLTLGQDLGFGTAAVAGTLLMFHGIRGLAFIVGQSCGLPYAGGSLVCGNLTPMP